jgi:TonB family protein
VKGWLATPAIAFVRPARDGPIGRQRTSLKNFACGPGVCAAGCHAHATMHTQAAANERSVHGRMSLRGMRRSIVNSGGSMRRAFLVSVGVPLLVAAAASATAQVPKPLSPNEPLPKGQRIEAKDGDTIVIRGDAHVRIVHRSEASVRAIYNSAQRWLVLLIDYADAKTGGPDGIVDSTCSFQDVEASWPLGERWQGSAVLDDYSMPYSPGGSLGITTDGAFVQLFSGSPAYNNRWFVDARAVTVSYGGSGRTNSTSGARQTFDQAEEHAMAEASRNAQHPGVQVSTMPMPGGGTATSALRMIGGPAGSRPTGDTGSTPPLQPVRVGGNIATPAKLVDAAPVTPPEMQQAGIRGVVILEIVIGTDGAVTDARILRGIVPALDRAAVDCVRKWRYALTSLNGQPVPVIMTATVSFQ